VKTLGLFRHAKSDWGDARARDFDRPLNKRGLKGARIMGEHIRNSGRRFDRIFASPAVRVSETIENAAKAWGAASFPVEWDRRIYLATSDGLMDLLRDLEGDPGAVLMIGHNPGLEDLIFDLVPEGSSPLREIVEEKFPTATYAVVELDIESWDDIDAGCGRLVEITRPRDLDPELGPVLVE